LRIYITHCTDTKKESLKDTGVEVPPDELYTARWIQRFMKKCKETRVNWAIFSDLYGVWFPWEEHMWYEMPPNDVSLRQFTNLVADLERKLQDYDEVCFYYNPGRFHHLYRMLVQVARPRGKKMKLITRFDDIT